MKSLTLGIIAGLVIVTVAGFWGAGDARADNGPHVRGQSMTTSACAGCHRAHAAQAAYLLKEDEEAICLSCHDGSVASTNVVDGRTTTGGALKGGGFSNASINTQDQTWRFSEQCVSGTLYGVACTIGSRVTYCGSGAAIPNPPPICTLPGGGGYTAPGTWLLTILPGASQPTTSKHNFGAAGMVWGNGPSGPATAAGTSTGANKLECTSCHDPHGNGQFRVLRPVPIGEGGLPAAGGLAPTWPGGVTIPDACPGGAGVNTSCIDVHIYTTANYMDSTYVTNTTGHPANTTAACSPTTTPCLDGGAPSQATAIGYSAWCSQCHSRYLARGVYATDSGDAVFKFRHSTESNPAYNGRQCNACHVSHGTNAAANATAAAASLAGDSALLKMDNRGMCLKCHKR